mgnify:CR=1 FL=1
MRYIQAFLKKILFLQKCDATTKQNQKEYTKGYKKNSANWRSSIRKRKLGDSNPRYGYPYGSLANCWFQPLTQTSNLLWERIFSQMRCKYRATF